MKHRFIKTLVTMILYQIMAFSQAIGMEVDDFFENEGPKFIHNLVPSPEMEPNLSNYGRGAQQFYASDPVVDIDPTTLPSSMDFSHLLPQIHHQYKLGSCVGQAITGAMEICLSKQNAYTRLSPLFVYYYGRVLAKTRDKDSGANLGNGMMAISTWGACQESTWSYDDYAIKFKKRPSPEANLEALLYKGLESIQQSAIRHNLNAIKQKLSQTIPVVLGLWVYQSFEKAFMGKIPMPSKTERRLGGHAIVLVGYNNETREFKFANSWGEEWGDKGFGTIAYDYIMNKSPEGDRAKYTFPHDIYGLSAVGRDEEESPRTPKNF